MLHPVVPNPLAIFAVAVKLGETQTPERPYCSASPVMVPLTSTVLAEEFGVALAVIMGGMVLVYVFPGLLIANATPATPTTTKDTMATR
jgi:hypothetical protein